MHGLTLSVIVVGVTAASAGALAQPCEVAIVHAPAAVRDVVDRWVAGERDCAGPLEVRIVPTERGLYVVAVDAEHRTFDREVPDAESAGALIVSWAVAATPARDVRVAVAAPDEHKPYDLRPPAMVDQAAPVAAPSSPGRGRLLSVGATYGVDVTDHRLGGHLAADLVQHGRWSAGLRVSALHSDDELLETVAVSALAYGAWTTAPSTWRLRAGLGVGVRHSWAQQQDHRFGSTSAPVLLDVTVSRQLSPRWAVAVGPSLGISPSFDPDGGLGVDLALRGTL